MLLGIVNGGLGLKLASASHTFMVAYSVIAGIIGALYIASAIFGHFRRSKQSKAMAAESDRPEATEERQLRSPRFKQY